MSRDLKDLQRAWRIFLIESGLPPLHRRAEALVGHGLSIPNPILDTLLPSLPYIKMTAMLDDALEYYVTTDATLSNAQAAPTLYGRIELLRQHSRPIDADGLHRIRTTRNDLAHGHDTRVDWERLRGDTGLVNGNLEALGLVGPQPIFEPFAERSKAKQSPKADVELSWEYQIGLKENGIVVAKWSWTENMMK